MSIRPFERIVLHESVTRDDIDHAMWKHGWRLANILAATESRPFQIVLLTADRRTTLRFYQDVRLGASYFVVSGDDVERGLREIAESLGTYGADETRALIEPGRPIDDYVRGVHYTALAARPSEAEQVQRVLRDALSHSDPSVRRAALASASSVGWPSLLALLEDAAARETSPELRSEIRALVAAWPRAER